MSDTPMGDARPISPADSVTQGWWDATSQHRLLVQRCSTCGHHQHYPRNICTACGAMDLTYDEACGEGIVYSHTTVMRAPHPAFEPPYVVALIRLAEGPMLMANIVGCAPEDVRCDMAVTLTWLDLPDGRSLPMFTPKG